MMKYRSAIPGAVALAIVPFGALGIPWNTWTALLALALVTGVVFCLQIALGRYRDSTLYRGEEVLIARPAEPRLPGP